MHVGKILIALIGVFLFLFTSVRGEIKDFSIKAFHLDFRAQVMTVPAIKELALDLSKKGINAIIIEYEATFPFKKHATLCNKYAYSRKDVKEIVDYCKSLGIDVIRFKIVSGTANIFCATTAILICAKIEKRFLKFVRLK